MPDAMTNRWPPPLGSHGGGAAVLRIAGLGLGAGAWQPQIEPLAHGHRVKLLLEYFDEHRAEPCGNCDTCLSPVESFDGTEAARKALSAVYRTGQMFGAAHVIDVLLGAWIVTGCENRARFRVRTSPTPFWSRNERTSHRRRVERPPAVPGVRHP